MSEYFEMVCHIAAAGKSSSVAVDPAISRGIREVNVNEPGVAQKCRKMELDDGTVMHRCRITARLPRLLFREKIG
jgi:hypothetical protein